MSNQRNAADRIRPFLQAMEQSIVAARQRRLNTHHQPAPSTTLTPAPPPPPVAPLLPLTAAPDAPIGDGGRPRLRARPKRPDALRGYEARSA
jgi:hypothetical protein